MLKYVLLAGAMAFSAPAFAQDVPLQESTVPQEAPIAEDIAPVPDETAPEVAPAPESDVQGEAEIAAQEEAVTEAEEARATPDQIAQLVESEFATYDTDSTGELSEQQFGEWMVALRSASEPGLQVDTPDVQAWIGQAFAQADADRSNGVSPDELTTFLAPGA